MTTPAKKKLAKKICLLGSYRVGKTSLVRQFVSSIYDEAYHVTLGVKIDKKLLSLDAADVELMIWDIAGAEDKSDVPKSYFAGLAGYLLVIDGTRAETVDRALDIARQVEAAAKKVPVVVLLNKSDLADQWKLDDAALAKLDPLAAPLLRTSAKTGDNVEAAFRMLGERIVQS